MTIRITASMVQALRARTGAGMMDCKRALEASAVIWIGLLKQCVSRAKLKRRKITSYCR